MWEYIFDYQQREIVKDKLTNDDLCLLFYFSKSIINEEFLFTTEPTLYKDFEYTKILQDVKTLYVGTKQLKRLIEKLDRTRYIQIEKGYSYARVILTFKMFYCLSKKQLQDEGNIKYMLLLKWTKMSNSKKSNGQKCPSFTEYYNNYITNYNYSNINNNNLNTRDIKYISSNIGNTQEPSFNSLTLLFEKYPKFTTNDDVMLPPKFNCEKLVNAIDKSDYLKNVNLYFLIHNYKTIIAGKYEKWADDKEGKSTCKNMCSKKVRDYSKEPDLLEGIE